MSSWEPQSTTTGTVRSWIRTPFGRRDERSRPTRPVPEPTREAALQCHRWSI